MIVDIKDCYDAFANAQRALAIKIDPTSITSDGNFAPRMFPKTFFDTLQELWQSELGVKVILKHPKSQWIELEFRDREHYLEWFFRWS